MKRAKPTLEDVRKLLAEAKRRLLRLARGRRERKEVENVFFDLPTRWTGR